MSRGLRIAAVTATLVATVLVVLALRSPDRRSGAVASTSPVDGAALAGAPTEVEMSFTAAVDPDRSHIAVRDGSGSTLNVGPTRAVAAKRLRQPVRTAAPGEVTVAYHVTFVAGGELTGRLRYRTGPAIAGGGAATATTAAATHEHGIDPVSAGLLVADGIVALVAVVLLLRRPRPRVPDRG